MNYNQVKQTLDVAKHEEIVHLRTEEVFLLTVMESKSIEALYGIDDIMEDPSQYKVVDKKLLVKYNRARTKFIELSAEIERVAKDI
jgi:ABC-type enterochelin transport system permease subunit